MALELMVGSIGFDGGSNTSTAVAAGAGIGVTGTGSSNATTATAPVAAGATTFTLTSATGWAIGQVFQMDVNSTVTPTTAEVRKVQNLVGSVVTVDVAFSFSHLTGVAVKTVSAPYTHTIVQGNNLPSFTIEKGIGLGQQYGESLQFLGSKINKFEVVCAATNTEVTQNIDIVSQHAQVLASSNAVTVVNESPYVFSEAALTLNSKSVAQCTSVNFDITNGLKDTFCLNGSHDLQFLSPVTRTCAAKVDVVTQNFDDADWGYWTLMSNRTNIGTFQFVLTHPASAGTITFSFPYTRILKYSDAVKIDGVDITSLSLDFGLNLSTLTTVSCTIVNNTWLPY